MGTTTKNPWDRLEGETSTAYAAFVIYLELGAERSIAKTAEERKSSKRYLEKWSSDYGWPERAAAWDEHAAALERDAIIAERITSKRARIDAAQEMLATGLEWLKEMKPAEARLSEVTGLLRTALEQLRKDYEGEESPEEFGDRVNEAVDRRLEELAGLDARDLSDTYRDVLARARQKAS